MKPNIPPHLTNGQPTNITYSSYYLLNPKYDIAIALKLLGDRANNSMIIKGKPEDFENNPNEVFRKISEEKTIQLKKGIKKWA